MNGKVWLELTLPFDGEYVAWQWMGSRCKKNGRTVLGTEQAVTDAYEAFNEWEAAQP